MKGFAGRLTCSKSTSKGGWDTGDSLLGRDGVDSAEVHGVEVGE